MGRISLKKIFSSVSNECLEKLFNDFNFTVDGVDWKTRKKNDTGTLCSYCLRLDASPENGNAVSAFFAVLNEITEVATAKKKLTGILEEYMGDNIGHSVLLPDFESRNPYDQAAYIYEFFNKAWKFILVRTRCVEMHDVGYWCEYENISGHRIQFDDVRPCIEESIMGFFKEKKKCDFCEVELCMTSGSIQYFTATLPDEPSVIEVREGEKTEFGFKEITTPYRFEFAYDYEKNRFSLHAPGIRDKKKGELASFILEAMFTLVNEDIERIKEKMYDLSVFCGPDCVLPSVPGIESAFVKKITFSDNQDACADISFRNPKRSVYDAVRQRICNFSGLSVIQVSLHLVINDPDRGTIPVNFSVTEYACTLKSKPERQRLLGEKLLEKLKVIPCPEQKVS